MECWCWWWVGGQGGCCFGSEGRICHFRGRGRYGGKLSLSLMIRDRDHGGSGAGWPCFAASLAGGVMRKLGPTSDWSPRLLYFVQTVIISDLFILAVYDAKHHIAVVCQVIHIASISYRCIHLQAIISRAGAIPWTLFLLSFGCSPSNLGQSRVASLKRAT
jgi:hypothetical protein